MTPTLWVALLLSVVLSACGESAPTAPRGEPQAVRGSLRVYDARIPAPPADVAALYLRAVDTGGRGDRLTGVSSPAAGHAMLHETRHEAGRMRMVPADGLAVPANGTLELRPGGAHAMLMRLARPLEEGEALAVVLEFERAGTIALDVPVVASGAAHAGH